MPISIFALYNGLMIIFTLLSVFIVSLIIYNRFATRLDDLKREFIETTYALKKRIERLEGGGLPPTQQATQPAASQSVGQQSFVASQTVQPPHEDVFSPQIPKPQEPTPPPMAVEDSNDISILANMPRFEDPVPQVVTANGGFEKKPHTNTQPDALTDFFAGIKNWFTTGNTLVKVGVVLIFFGVSFLLQYAIENNHLPIEIRLLGAAIGGVGLVYLGWRTTAKRRDYGLVLQGGGIGVLFLTTFVALKGYGLIPPTFAFLALIMFTVATAFLAVHQDSMELAAFGVIGGFLAPILVSTGQGQHVVLFSYYSLLNLGILYVSHMKAWRTLNLIGFIFTFAIGTIWGVLKYKPEFYWSTQPFLILFFAIYLIIPILFAKKREPELKGYVDGTLVFGNSLLTLVLQLELVKGIYLAGAFSAVALAAVYILLSRQLYRNANPNFRLLADAFIAIGTVFITAAVPLAFDGLKTSAIWAVEAAGIYWFAIRQNRSSARVFSTLLIIASSFAFMVGPSRGSSAVPFLNTFFFSCIMMAGGYYVIAYFANKYWEKLSTTERESQVSNLMFIVGSVWWTIGGLSEIDRSFPQNQLGPFINNFNLMYLSVGASILFFIGHRKNWIQTYVLGHLLAIPMLFYFLVDIESPQVFGNAGLAAWTLAFICYYKMLSRSEPVLSIAYPTFYGLGHAAALWALLGVLSQSVFNFSTEYLPRGSDWRSASLAFVPTFAYWLIVYQNRRVLSWPLLTHQKTYFTLGLTPVMIFAWCFTMYTNWVRSGNSSPLPYLPIFNPIEIAHVALLLILTDWSLRLSGGEFNVPEIKRQDVGRFLGFTYFMWLNGVVCRVIHHVFDVPFQFRYLFASTEVQVSLSLFWTLLGIGLMIIASRKAYRWLWVTGAGLLGVVVAKMFMIDLSKIETIARVVSFLGVGVLFLVVGYYSPIPPKTEKN